MDEPFAAWVFKDITFRLDLAKLGAPEPARPPNRQQRRDKARKGKG